MEKEIAELKQYLKDVSSFSLPKYKELPGVELYMEQVLKFINGALQTLSPSEERQLTSFMVNNYVKAKMVSEPIKKKYSRDQIGYLMAICLMKSTISMSDMSLLLELDKGISTDKGKLYAFFCELETSILSEASNKISTKVDQIGKRFKVEKKTNKEKAINSARDGLGLLALRLAISSQANKLLSDYIISLLRKELHSETASKEITPSSHELKHEAIIGEKEARRLAEAKNEQAKANAKKSLNTKQKNKKEKKQ
ncbi:MAG TPA: hypothetical protein DEF61_05665 [Firmicutes bacterium]|nr:hypothetical protein [Bacillota bacterium]HBM70190.1 hypothetical protein [Bacillota bacterium]HBX25708.1 hypothetical protein [Bacillota bacterium]